MKKINYKLKLASLLFLMLAFNSLRSQCVANFSVAQGANGSVSLTNLSTGSATNTGYGWSTQNNFFSSQTNASYTFAANGIYSITLVMSTPNVCTVQATQTVAISNVTCAIQPNFAWFTGSNGVINFTNTSIGSTSATPFYWNFGNGNMGFTQFNQGTSSTYTANGSYTACLTATAGACVASTCIPINVTNASTCALVANGGLSSNTNGIYTFVNLSTGTNSNTTYFWNFGNGNTSTALNPTTTYSAQGIYTVCLTAVNSNTLCNSTQCFTIFANIVSCAIQANYTSSVSGNSVIFSSTSTNTVATTSYTWNFGNGTFGYTANPPAATYTANGTYTVCLTAYTTNTCQNTYCNVISITSNSTPCNLNANFSHTTTGNGGVNFISTTTGITGPVNYQWNFGNGFIANGSSVSHNYTSNGAYNVTLTVTSANNPTCFSTFVQSVNITNSSNGCVANSNFSVVPTATLQSWQAIPTSPWNVVAATWAWGDGNTSNGLYSSHQYAAAGMYNICLTVTVSCGATSTTCFNTNIYKTNNAIISINVVAPNSTPLGFTNQDLNANAFTVYPNPSNGAFNVNLEQLKQKSVNITVYNLIGEVMYSKQNIKNIDRETINLNEIGSGVYFIKISAENGEFTKKLIKE